MNSTNKDVTNCVTLIPWWFSFALSLFIFFLGLTIIGLIYVKKKLYLSRWKNNIKKGLMNRRPCLLTRCASNEVILKETIIKMNTKFDKSIPISFTSLCEIIVSKGTNLGKILNIFQVSCHLLSWSIYVVFTHYQGDINGSCYYDNMGIIQWIDFGLNVFCTLYFILQTMAVNDILKFWISLTTIVDICVIPNILITTFLNVRQQGMSFLRILYLHDICDIIIIVLGIETKDLPTEMTRMFMSTFSVWMASSGCFLWFERFGDFWQTPVVNQQFGFWNTAYFTIITISTIGYGDVAPVTVMGRILFCFCIIYLSTVFYMYMTKVADSIELNKNEINYISYKGKRRILACGKFDKSTISIFLKAFINPKLRKLACHIAVLDKRSGSQNLYSFIKRISSTVKYVMGSLLQHKDLKLLKLPQTNIAVILSLPYSSVPIDDDFDNIMYAISLKSQRAQLRTIVQMHLYSNKILLKMFPTWNKNGKDIIICIDEIRFGLIGYSCLIPGISTLITNLITLTKAKKVSSTWEKNYGEGLENRIFSVNFSEDFQGFDCLEVALIIYNLWEVCLLAIKYTNVPDSDFTLINPMKENLKIDTNSMIAIVMTRNEESAHKIPFFCLTCSYVNPSKICNCWMKKCRPKNFENDIMLNNRPGFQKEVDCKLEQTHIKSNQEHSTTTTDQTSSFYWTPEPNFNEICLEVNKAESLHISKHVLVCLIGPKNQNIDLCNFMMPLRSRYLKQNRLRKIVILSKRTHFEDNGWINIKNFPMFLIINGSPMNIRDLRAAGLLNCKTCAVINCENESDKNSIICTTIINSIKKQYKLKYSVITEIKKDDVVYHFDSDNVMKYSTNLKIQQTESFAKGLIFSNSILYESIYSICYNPDIFSFVNAFLTGPYGDKVERMLGYGCGMLPHKKDFVQQKQSGVAFQLISISKPPFDCFSELYEGNLTYDTLFKWALVEKGILCFGLYRLNFWKFRYVFTNPPKATEIYITDKVYCCIPSKSSDI